MESQKQYQLEWIVSGGQTGADRGGLDAAIMMLIPHTGWCPKGRRAEDGAIPDQYRMIEHTSTDYRERTRLNIESSDGTFIFYDTNREPGPGTKLTIRLCEQLKKPHLIIGVKNAAEPTQTAVDLCYHWLEEHNIRRLNIAGSRESKQPGIQRIVRDFLVQVVEGFEQKYE